MNKSDDSSECIASLQFSIPSKLRLIADGLSEIPFPVGQSSPRSPIHCESDDDEKHRSLVKTVSFATSSPPSSKAVDGRSASFSRGGLPDEETAAATPTLIAESGKKRISWCKRVRIKEIRHISHFTDIEKNAIWMTEEDYQMAKFLVKTTVMMMKRKDILEDDPEFCTRGLEFRTKIGSKAHRRNKVRTRSAVLIEQDLQRQEGFSNPEFIAMASMELSFGCREGARKRAFGDAKCIEAYMDDVRQPLR